MSPYVRYSYHVKQRSGKTVALLFCEKGEIKLATSRLMPKHIDEGKSILATIKRSIDYGKNPQKTRAGSLLSSYECDARTATEEFLLAKKEYVHLTGRRQDPEHDILFYQIRQSFMPGEITPEKANQLAYELAHTFTKGKHAFVVATHEDKKHIHSHIYFNSTTLDCGGKFNNFFLSAIAVRRISDRICLENGLSIVENPKSKGKHYGAWQASQDDKSARSSFKQTIKDAIDTALLQRPTSFADFVFLMEQAGFIIGGGKHKNVLAPGQKKPARFDTLKGDYTEQAILERILGKRIVPLKPAIKPAEDAPETQTLKLLIDVQNSLKAKDSPGYARWAKLFNLKQLSQTINYVTENKLTLTDLDAKAQDAASQFNELSGKIRKLESRLAEITALQTHIGNYGKTREVYSQYRKNGYSKKFLAAHEKEIALHKESKKVFDTLGLKKIPSVSGLRQEYAQLLTEKKKLYSSYHGAKEEMKTVLIAKANLDRLLNRDDISKEAYHSNPEV